MFKILSSLKNIFKLALSNELHIYTDGSHKGKWGSWAFVVVKNNKIIHESSGKLGKTNSNRMEFQAAIEALKYLKQGDKACIYTDSRVLIKAVNSKIDRPAASEDQLIVLDELIKNKFITWKWVKAHSGHPYNERCDQLCIKART